MEWFAWSTTVETSVAGDDLPEVTKKHHVLSETMLLVKSGVMKVWFYLGSKFDLPLFSNHADPK